MIIICNFTPMEHVSYQIGVPYRGKYKEIFSSDESRFGGEGKTNKTLKQTKKESCNERDYSISVTVPPLSFTVFKYKEK